MRGRKAIEAEREEEKEREREKVFLYLPFLARQSVCLLPLLLCSHFSSSFFFPSFLPSTCRQNPLSLSLSLSLCCCCHWPQWRSRRRRHCLVRTPACYQPAAKPITLQGQTMTVSALANVILSLNITHTHCNTPSKIEWVCVCLCLLSGWGEISKSANRKQTNKPLRRQGVSFERGSESMVMMMMIVTPIAQRWDQKGEKTEKNQSTHKTGN